MIQCRWSAAASAARASNVSSTRAAAPFRLLYGGIRLRLVATETGAGTGPATCASRTGLRSTPARTASSSACEFGD